MVKKVIRFAARFLKWDAEQTITELGVGEALVLLLDDEGRPTLVQRVKIAPPESRVGPLNDAERAERVVRSA